MSQQYETKYVFRFQFPRAEDNLPTFKNYTKDYRKFVDFEDQWTMTSNGQVQVNIDGYTFVLGDRKKARSYITKLEREECDSVHSIISVGIPLLTDSESYKWTFEYPENHSILTQLDETFKPIVHKVKSRQNFVNSIQKDTNTGNYLVKLDHCRYVEAPSRAELLRCLKATR